MIGATGNSEPLSPIGATRAFAASPRHPKAVVNVPAGRAVVGPVRASKVPGMAE